MNSFISIFEMEWRRALALYALLTLLLGGVLAAAIIVLDPYDSGHYAVFGDQGVPHFGQRLADASIARNRQWDIAIIGNSTIQLLDPVMIGAEQHQAASLAIPGTGPREQLSIADFFLRHHPHPYAVILGIDARWCEANHALELSHPFPFWLYGDSRRDYLLNILQFQSLDGALRKVKLLLGKTQSAPVNGYNDYDAGREWKRSEFLSRKDAPVDDAQVLTPVAPPYNFAAVELLKDFFARLPRDTKIILVVPPQYQPAINPQQNACEAAYAGLVRQQRHAHMIDFLSHRDLTGQDQDYWDRLHYRARVARVMEEDVNAKLR